MSIYIKTCCRSFEKLGGFTWTLIWRWCLISNDLDTGCIILAKKKCTVCKNSSIRHYLDRVKRIWYLSPMRAAKVQASLRIRAVSPEPSLLAHRSSESRGTFRQKARSLTPLNGWACAVKMCHDGMLEDTNSLDGAHLYFVIVNTVQYTYKQNV